MGVSDCSAVTRADEQFGTHGEIVWSWPPDAEVTLAVMIRRSRGQDSPVPGESTYKPSNHRAGNAGMSRLNLWFLPPAFFSAGGPWVRPAPGIPCALVIRGRTTTMARTRKAPRGRNGMALTRAIDAGG